jgi:hypothetical protein
MAVTEQLMRDGVRLAQALDTIATAFFWSENQAIAPAVSPVQRNRFADLDFDADNFVFDPQGSSETGGDTELEIGDEDVVLFTVPTSASATAGSKSPKRRKRATGAKKKTDLNSLVLVKENGRFCITSEARANVKTDLCGFGASVVGIRFGAAEHETFFWLDPLIFGTERVPPLARLEATFKHLKGVSGSDLVVPEIALDFSAGAAVSFQSLTDSLTMPAFRELTGSETAKLPVATFETISDFVRPVESETVLRKRFGGKFPSAETRIRDVLRREPGLMVILHGKALLVSSLSALQGEKGNRFVLNAIRVGGHHALVDSRIIDEVIPPSVFGELLKLLLRPEIRAAKKALVEANYPIIRVLPNLADLMTSGESTVTLVGLNAKCTQLTAINREAGYRSLDFTLTSVAESRRRIANAAKGMIGSFADGNPVYDVLKRLIPHVIDDFRAEADDDGETVSLPVHHIEGQTILAALSSIQASGAEFSPASLARERRRFEGSFV